MAAASFPAYIVTGPVHHYVRGIGGAPLYLGTCEVQPRIQEVEARLPIMNDIAGRSLPAQEKDDGRQAMLSVMLNRFSYSTMNALTPAGVQGRFSRGLMIYGLKTFELWQLFENATDPAVRALYPNLPLGYYWPQVDWVSKEDAPGNSDEKILCQFKATNLFTPQANASAVAPGERQWFLRGTSDDWFAPGFAPGVTVPQ